MSKSSGRVEYPDIELSQSLTSSGGLESRTYGDVLIRIWGIRISRVTHCNNVLPAIISSGVKSVMVFVGIGDSSLLVQVEINFASSDTLT